MFYCTIARWFDNAVVDQPVLHFLGFANFKQLTTQNVFKDCGGCDPRTGDDRYPTWANLKTHYSNHKNFLPHIKSSFKVPMEATIGLFQDRGCKAGISVYFNTKEEVPGTFLGDSSAWKHRNYDAEYWGPLVTFYQCCSHPVLKSSMTKAQFLDDSFWDAIDDDNDHLLTMAFSDYHNSVDDDWNSPADPDAWKDNWQQDDGENDYFHFLNGDYLSSYVHSDETNDYYNKLVINFKIIIPKSGNVEMHIFLPEDIADYTDNVFQTENRDNAEDNDGHPGVRNKRSVPNPFGSSDSVYIHLGGGWMGNSNAYNNNKDLGLMLYNVEATTEEQLFGIGGEASGLGINSDGKVLSVGLGGSEYSDYDGDGESDFGIRMKTLSVKSL